ncbi:hypothetical protein CEUSTIGMA_g2705.t1 [Chlamydomonas eustigma]|uniref:Uncharacterized protein n=1 Tax=Chlamydomonas eustigma TaxID=1157962 RepID=A0A250WXK2_9CHLO|nr:hypothetical protein CEUSTIGMA_g2705.t1 [Chlamydomonas eustigma]|eukprot:GAX75260.1 hypothetical protein CEUSTIGMA_g2705.t1 [Chlamydomonas eustigma]
MIQDHDDSDQQQRRHMPAPGELVSLVLHTSPGLANVVAEGSPALSEQVLQGLTEAAETVHHGVLHVHPMKVVAMKQAMSMKSSPDIHALTTEDGYIAQISPEIGYNERGGLLSEGGDETSSHESASLAALMVCTADTWIQALVTNLQLSSLLVSEPQLAHAVVHNKRLAHFLANNADFVEAVRLCPGFGSVLVAHPGHVADAIVLEEEGRLATALVACPELMQEICINSTLALAVSGGVIVLGQRTSNKGADSPLAGAAGLGKDGGAGVSGTSLAAAAAYGSCFAQRIARDPDLLQAMQPQLLRLSVSHDVVLQLLATHATCELIEALSANDAALAHAVVAQPAILPKALTQLPLLPALLASHPVMCKVLAGSPHLCEVLADAKSGLFDLLGDQQEDVVDALAGNRHLQQLIVQLGAPFISALASDNAALLTTLLKHNNMLQALLTQHSKGTIPTQQQKVTVPAASTPSVLQALLTQHPEAMKILCHSPQLIHRCLEDPQVASCLLPAAVSTSRHQDDEEDCGTSGSSPSSGSVLKVESGAGDGKASTGSAVVGHQRLPVFSDETLTSPLNPAVMTSQTRSDYSSQCNVSDLLSLLANDQPLCETLSRHPTLLTAAAAYHFGGFTDAGFINPEVNPSTSGATVFMSQEALGALDGITQDYNYDQRHSSRQSQHPLVVQPDLVVLLVTSPSMAQEAACNSMLYKALIEDAPFTSFLLQAPRLTTLLVSSPELAGILSASGKMREAVMQTPKIALAIVRDSNLSQALSPLIPLANTRQAAAYLSRTNDNEVGAVDLGYNAGRSFVGDPLTTSSSSEPATFVVNPSSYHTADKSVEEALQLASALCSNADFSMAVANSRDLRGAVTSQPGLAKALARSIAMSTALKRSHRLCEAIAGVPELMQALIDVHGLADLVGDFGALARLLISDAKFSATLGSYRPLSDALIRDHRLIHLLAAQEGALAALVTYKPALAFEIATNTQLTELLVSNEGLAALLAKEKDLQDLVLIPDFASRLAESSALQQLLSSGDTGKALLSQRELMQAVWTVPDLDEGLAENPELTEALCKTPSLLQCLTESPTLAMIVIRSPDLRELILSNLRIASLAASSYLLYSNLLRAKYVSQLGDNKELAAVLMRCPTVVATMLTDIRLRDLITGSPEMGNAIVASPRLAEVLSFDDTLVSTLSEHQPGLPAALSAHEGRLAVLMAEDAGLAKAVARDPDLATALSAEGSGLELATAMCECPPLTSAVIGRTQAAVAVLEHPQTYRVISSNPKVFQAIILKPELAQAIAGSHALSSFLMHHPALGAALCSSDGRFLSELLLLDHGDGPSSNAAPAFMNHRQDEAPNSVALQQPLSFTPESAEAPPAPLMLKLLEANEKLLLLVTAEPWGPCLASSLASLMQQYRSTRKSGTLQGHASTSSSEVNVSTPPSVSDPDAPHIAHLSPGLKGLASLLEGVRDKGPTRGKKLSAAIKVLDASAVDAIVEHCCSECSISAPHVWAEVTRALSEREKKKQVEREGLQEGAAEKLARDMAEQELRPWQVASSAAILAVVASSLALYFGSGSTADIFNTKRTVVEPATVYKQMVVDVTVEYNELSRLGYIPKFEKPTEVTFQDAAFSTLSSLQTRVQSTLTSWIDTGIAAPTEVLEKQLKVDITAVVAAETYIVGSVSTDEASLLPLITRSANLMSRLVAGKLYTSAVEAAPTVLAVAEEKVKEGVEAVKGFLTGEGNGGEEEGEDGEDGDSSADEAEGGGGPNPLTVLQVSTAVAGIAGAGRAASSSDQQSNVQDQSAGQVGGMSSQQDKHGMMGERSARRPGRRRKYRSGLESQDEYDEEAKMMIMTSTDLSAADLEEDESFH